MADMHDVLQTAKINVLEGHVADQIKYGCDLHQRILALEDIITAKTKKISEQADIIDAQAFIIGRLNDTINHPTPEPRPEHSATFIVFAYIVGGYCGAVLAIIIESLLK